MLTATEEFARIRDDAEKIKSNKTQRFPEAANDGDYWRQGDVYITYRDKLPPLAKADAKPNAQLAPGSTQGSRHILDSLDGVTMYQIDDASALQGPVLKVDTERTVTHPEHGNVVLPPGCYEITYQRAYAEELRRVLD